VTPTDFKREIAEAVRVYDRHVVSLEKCTDEFHQILLSLVIKAITAYENRGSGLRHGIALDKHITVILSQTDTARPICGIYFNLYSPYHKKSQPKTVKPIEETRDDAEV
jgi:hypothetical protein